MSAKLPFTDLPGVPAADDPEVTALLAVFADLPRENLTWAISLLIRGALAWERTGSTDQIAGLAEDTLGSLRFHRRPGVAEMFAKARDRKPPVPGTGVNVIEALRERGLLRSDSR